MAKDVKIPSLGESITEATILSWYKKKGEKVALDEPLLEVETDKISMEINAPAAGVVVSVSKEEGDTVCIGDVVATIDESASPTTEKTEERTLEPEPLEKKIEKSSPPKNGPAAEKAMREAGISADDMKDPTGKDGRVTKSDVERAIKDAKRPQSSQEKVEKPQEDEKGVSRKPMSALRKKIAERMVAAQQNAAILTTFNEVDMSEVLALREKYKDDFLETHGVKLGFMGFFVKACVYALKEIPALNAEIEGDDILYKDFVNMGVAVSTERGLVVPVVRDAHDMSFAGTEKAIHALAEKARDGKLAMTDLSGGTFTISNGGVFGSLLSTPIINPPQSGILGMHKIEKRAVVVNDEIQIRPMMYLALSYDHRIIDGKEAVTFLAHVKESLEDPERMLLEL